MGLATLERCRLQAGVGCNIPALSWILIPVGALTPECQSVVSVPLHRRKGEGGGNVCNSNREKNWTQRISIVVSVAGSLQQGHKAEKPNPQISSIPARASCGGARPAVPRPAAGVEMGGL